MNMTTWYYNNIGSKFTKGYFVEIGVMNGKTQNSTKILEMNGWEGLLVEPVPSNIKAIKKNRSTPLVEGAVWKEDGIVEIVDTGIRGHTGIKETHKNLKAAKSFIKAKSYKFESLPVPYHIDYLQIDTEGSELEILKATDLNKFIIDYICIEDNEGFHNQNPAYHNFMEQAGYEKVHSIAQDSLYKRL
jgi:FkbM family methyltransferase